MYYCKKFYGIKVNYCLLQLVQIDRSTIELGFTCKQVQLNNQVLKFFLSNLCVKHKETFTLSWDNGKKNKRQKKLNMISSLFKTSPNYTRLIRKCCFDQAFQLWGSKPELHRDPKMRWLFIIQEILDYQAISQLLLTLECLWVIQATIKIPKWGTLLFNYILDF